MLSTTATSRAPTSQDELEQILGARDTIGWDQPWHRWASHAYQRGHCEFIGTRKPGGLYLARFWVSPPRRRAGQDKWANGDSVLLHYFARGDDDEALHDHPWAYFHTELLAGGYDEYLPPLDWEEDAQAIGLDDARECLGPPWDHRVETRLPGDPRRTVVHGQLHCVGAVLPGTWSLVTTGPRIQADAGRDWGFHPPGRPWIPYQAYLDERAQA